ncbi:MAG: YidC/Oxa1 family membrane protein insertase [Dehalococcoidia bacterium]
MEFLGLLWNEIIIRPMTNSLLVLYVLLGANLGLAIIGFTVIVRSMTYPLVVRQFRQMRKMQELQPKMKALNERYKNDPQKRGQEVMKLYKEMGVNPVGCLGPLVVQMPIFIGLFWSINYVLPFTPENLAGLADRLYSWLPMLHEAVPVDRHFLGMDLALETMRSGSILGFVLVALSGGSMYVQQKMSQMPTTDPSQLAQQRMMVLMFPVMFGMFSLFFPLGLVIYWVASNIIGIVMQYFVTGWGSLRPQPAGMPSPKLGPTLTTAPARAAEDPPDKEREGDAESEPGADGQDGRRGDRTGGTGTRRRSRRGRSRRH